MMAEQANDFRRTVCKDVAFSTCLNCSTSLMSAPAQKMPKLEADHRIECEGRRIGRTENREWNRPLWAKVLIDCNLLNRALRCAVSTLPLTIAFCL
jgi:hypothetical protein